MLVNIVFVTVGEKLKDRYLLELIRTCKEEYNIDDFKEKIFLCLMMSLSSRSEERKIFQKKKNDAKAIKTFE
jgi:hypothetical protein